MNNDDLLTLSISCLNNPQCIYSGQDYFPIITKIKNNSNENLELPLEVIKVKSRLSFKTIETREDIGNAYPPALSDPQRDSHLTLLPAHGEITIEGGFSKADLEAAFDEADFDQILLFERVSTKVYCQGSKEPIGYYRGGGYEPQKFKMQSELIITKKQISF